MRQGTNDADFRGFAKKSACNWNGLHYGVGWRLRHGDALLCCVEKKKNGGVGGGVSWLEGKRGGAPSGHAAGAFSSLARFTWAYSCSLMS